jgi:hypothetical protein
MAGTAACAKGGVSSSGRLHRRPHHTAPASSLPPCRPGRRLATGPRTGPLRSGERPGRPAGGSRLDLVRDEAALVFAYSASERDMQPCRVAAQHPAQHLKIAQPHRHGRHLADHRTDIFPPLISSPALAGSRASRRSRTRPARPPAAAIPTAPDPPVSSSRAPTAASQRYTDPDPAGDESASG